MSNPERTTAESELTAASALACLRTNETKEQKHIPDASSSKEADFAVPQRFTKSGRIRAVPFTIKLMKVLSDKKNAHIITWMPSGKAFSILKPKVFVAEILPQDFKTAKYSSFTRKLHRWGFMRQYRGEEAGAFYHNDFQRGCLDLVEQMTCQKVEPPKSAVAISSSVAAEKVSKHIVAVKPFAAAKPCAAVKPAVAAKPLRVVKPVAVKRLHVVKPVEFNSQYTVLATHPTTILPINFSAAAALAANTSLPPMATQLPASTAAALHTDRLNAAIEHEVNRRMKERINALALSRQAFAVSAMRQRQLQSATNMNSYSELAAALLLQKQAGGLAHAPVAPAPEGMGYRALTGEGRPMPGAPPINIQGARTA